MIDTVLVPMDDSEMAENALEYALESFPDASVTVIHVVGEPSSMMGQATGLALAEDLEAEAAEYAAPVFETARDIATRHDREIETTVGIGQPARAILNRVEEFDTVVLGTHGGSLTDRLFVGNVAERVFRRSPVPVTVIR
ncbi:universal stress protein [Halodesulfurarchaeum sp.]|uniref:universal stress protein n=1 Tax=Halodesulfurarchaeum sp. TaxID=1980530 RepID=UPI002FC29309